jgi:hypothetical protein
MKIQLKRTARKPNYTVGRLSIDGVYQCDTLEDTDRGLRQGMPLEQLKRMKKYGETAIPTGTYVVLWTFSNRFGMYMPELDNVPAFSGIRIHSGNTAKDSLGCILVGENKYVGQVVNSRATYRRIAAKILAAINRGECINITIE